MPWMRSHDHSLYPDETSLLLSQSSSMFNAVANTEPADVYDQYGPSTPQIIKGAVEMAGIEPDPSIEPYLVYGLRDVSRVVQSAFVYGRLRDSTLEQRIAIAQHPKTALALGILASRPEELMDTQIGDYAGGIPAIVLSDDESHLTTALAAHTSERRCPFAVQPETQSISPVFIKFCQWSAAIAVMQDHPSYLRRTE